MEAIFRREGLPLELTRLPFVESCFNVRAYSKVGAAGIWQFMPATGRLYMRVDDTVDERRDPIVATRAAARHLRRDYEALGTWPLAVSAYNHGRAGMARAVASVGTTDLVQIVRHYDGPSFKFASRNFYAEFLAALEVERHAERYFGTLRPQAPVMTDSVYVPKAVPLHALARMAEVSPDTLASLNPALAPDVVEGRLPVPSGYLLRVPDGVAADVERRYASAIAAERPPPKPKAKGSAAYVRHRVQRGQTLAGIARRYRTSVAAIKRHNRLGPSARVRTGQSLIIPTG
jgi:membrane-bound lytic murein transglycosylase D